GTLDPMATGVLVVCVGRATRLISYVQQQPNEYRARFRLGERSDTDDATGTIERVAVDRSVTRPEIEALLPRFVGTIEQVPPQFSAVHVGGRRAYDLARRGQTLDLQPRSVEVYHIELRRYEWPHLELDIECGSGTYIRAIGRDLGDALGCGAVMTNLIRTRIGPFSIDEALDLDRLEKDPLEPLLLPAAKAVEHLPRYVCESADVAHLRAGRAIRPRQSFAADSTPVVAVITPNGELACIAHPQGPTLAPKPVFLR
ncbi:MAG: tRNA pseudouridine(55) synthase TruB, partial [Planctomycetaceae bacterium]